MKTLHFGWEAGSFQNSQVKSVLTAPVDMRIKGYSLSLSMGTPSAPAFFGVGRSYLSVVLFALFYVPQSPDAFAAMTLAQTSGTNTAGQHGSGGDTNILACAILRHTVPGQVNECPCMVGLDIPIAAGTPITSRADHAGYVSDFEVQGILYYE